MNLPSGQTDAKSSLVWADSRQWQSQRLRLGLRWTWSCARRLSKKVGCSSPVNFYHQKSMWKLFSKYHTAKWLPPADCVLTLDRIIVLHFSGIAALIVAWSEERCHNGECSSQAGESMRSIPGGPLRGSTKEGCWKRKDIALFKKETKMVLCPDFSKKRYSFDLKETHVQARLI